MSHVAYKTTMALCGLVPEMGSIDLTDKKFYTFKSYSSEKGSLMSSYILDLAKSPTGQIWVSTNLGLQKYDYQTDSFTLIDFTKGINCIHYNLTSKEISG